MINNTTTATNPTILMPVQNDALAACRKLDIRFVRIQCSIDFALLVTIPNPGPTFCLD
jgi:hypothetical protein